jgi:hypothetical protein
MMKIPLNHFVIVKEKRNIYLYINNHKDTHI